MSTTQETKAPASFTATQRKDALPPPPLSILAKKLEVDELSIEWLAGDGSDRCYYRISSPHLQRDYVLMQLSENDAIKLKENGYEWIAIGELLARHGVIVPRTVAKIPEYAAIVIEDYGNQMLETVIMRDIERSPQIDCYYDLALKNISHFLKIPAEPGTVWTTRAFDEERFVWEMNFFQKYFIEQVCNLSFDKDQNETFQCECRALSKFLAGYSKYFVHRDYHTRNLMFQDERVAVIDFQDARLGPPSYDLVSLCFDSYIPLDQKTRLRYLESFIVKLSDKKLAQEIEISWPAMLLQRQYKALGSFGYLSIVKKRGNYLQYIKPALATLENTAVFDKRWPFISGELVKLIASNIG